MYDLETANDGLSASLYATTWLTAILQFTAWGTAFCGWSTYEFWKDFWRDCIFIQKVVVDNKLSEAPVLVWERIGNKPFYKPLMTVLSVPYIRHACASSGYEKQGQVITSHSLYGGVVGVWCGWCVCVCGCGCVCVCVCGGGGGGGGLGGVAGHRSFSICGNMRNGARSLEGRQMLAEKLDMFVARFSSHQ